MASSVHVPKALELIMAGQSQTAFAKQLNIDRTRLCRHLAGMAMSRESLGSYLQNLDDSKDRKVLLLAWLQDLLGPEVLDELREENASSVLNETVREFGVQLSCEATKALEYLQLEMRKDTELENAFLKFAKFAGWIGKR